MPTIIMFYGILVMMYFRDIDHHQSPHIHVEYQDFNAEKKGSREKGVRS